MQRIAIVLSILFLSSGCVMVGGYSSGRGWFFWPGGLGIFLVIVLLVLLLRRRK